MAFEFWDDPNTKHEEKQNEFYEKFLEISNEFNGKKSLTVFKLYIKQTFYIY